MKKMGLIVAIFFGAILLTSTVVISLPNLMEPLGNEDVTITGTPADNFPDDQRAQFCGSGTAKSTPYVTEYSIPTACTNPLAIVTDYSGNVWFTETNTGNLAKFDPVTETFSEFKNPFWLPGARSMMWGIDYSPDDSLWFTDEAYDSIWRFSIPDEEYSRLNYPSDGNSLPQKLLVDGSQIVVNDFTGNKITFLDQAQSTEDINYLSLPSPVENSVTGDFTIDKNDYVWYTNWAFEQSGVLVKFDQNGYKKDVIELSDQYLPLSDYIEIFPLPPELQTPNGIVVVNDGTLWLADTSSSFFFNFDPISEQFTQYVTSVPKLSTFGNSTGVIKSPISRPYWIDADSSDNLVFNEQTSNSIAVMNPKSESLVEYFIPSMNPSWGDCGENPNCGLAQVFDFTIDGEKIWFTEWVENNIGVIDTSVALPYNIELDSKNISIKPGESVNLEFVISPQSSQDLFGMSLILSSSTDSLDISAEVVSSPFQLDFDGAKTIPVKISANDEIVPGTYKVLLGSQIDDISISKFVTVSIES